MCMNKYDELMTLKYGVFRIFVKVNNFSSTYCRTTTYSYIDMLECLKKYLDSSFYSHLYVQYGYTYTECYRLNGIDHLETRDSNKLFKKAIMEYKLESGTNA